MDGGTEGSECSEKKKPLSREFWKYGAVWLSFLIYSALHFSLKTRDVAYKYDGWGFDEGSYGLSMRRDQADSEWFLCVKAFSDWYVWVLVHPVVTQVLLRSCRQALPYFYALYTSVFMFFALGWVPLAMFHTVYITMYLAAASGLRWLCYLIPAFFMAALQLRWIPQSVMVAAYGRGYMEGHMVHIGLAWTVARCLSFSVDAVVEGRQPPLWKSMAYVFYWPCIFIGPLTDYTSFEKELDRAPQLWKLSKETLRLVIDLGRCFLVYFLYNLFTHFFYVSVIRWDPDVVSEMDSWAAAGFSMLIIMMFYMKYRVLYGMSVALAALEGIRLPAAPKCIGHVSVCSYLWKYFDRGLHLWLVKYIYKPVLGSQRRLARGVVGTAGCFFFIWVWHGMRTSITIWCSLNFLGIVGEQVTAQLLATQFGAKLMSKYSSRLRPLQASLSAISVILSGTSCLFFLAGDTVSFIVTKKLLLGFPLPALLVFLAFYCNGYAALELREWEKSTAKPAKEAKKE